MLEKKPRIKKEKTERVGTSTSYNAPDDGSTVYIPPDKKELEKFYDNIFRR